MVRYTIEKYNNSNTSIPLVFNNIKLTEPLTVDKYVSIFSYSIPNALTPIMIFKKLTYLITLEYNDGINPTYTANAYVGLLSRGFGTSIYSLQHFADCINITLSGLVTTLTTSLPSTDNPYITYNSSSGLYSIIAPVEYDSDAAHPIKIYMNEELYYIFKSLPGAYANITGKEVLLLFNNTYENTYNTTYLKSNQVSHSLDNYAYMRLLTVSTNLPIESEFSIQDTIGSRTVPNNTLANYTVEYTNGTLDVFSNNNYQSPVNEYRTAPCHASNIQNIGVNVSYIGNDLSVNQFILPPYTSAFIVLEMI